MSSKKYVKKPVVIDALQWTGENFIDMCNFLENAKNDYILNVGSNFYWDPARVKGGLIIKTLEGEHLASIDDFIIKGIKGEFYPCKPDVFEATYAEVAE